MWKQGDENTISTSKEPFSFPWPKYHILQQSEDRVGVGTRTRVSTSCKLPVRSGQLLYLTDRRQAAGELPGF